MNKPQPLVCELIPYAYWTEATDPETGCPRPGLGSNRIYRFHRPALLTAMEITRKADATGGRPEQVTIEAFDGPEPRGKVLHDGALHWRGDKCRLEFPPTPALAVSQRCHWKSNVHVSFHEFHSVRWTVPFNIFEKTEWFGKPTRLAIPEPPVHPALRRGRIEPRGLRQLEAWSDGLFAHFESRWFKVAFCLERPRVHHLSWDTLGTRPLSKNFLVEFLPSQASGPWLRTVWAPVPPFLWTGTVEVAKNRVQYSDLRSVDGLTLDAEFEIEPRGMVLRLRQQCARATTFLEAEAWRFVWDGTQVYSLGTLAMPARGCQRNGRTALRGGWHATNRGTLSFESSNPATALQTDTSGFYGRRRLYSGMQVGARPEPFGPVTLLAGTHETEIRLAVTKIEPDRRLRAKTHPGLRRAWGSPFAFRPEGGGFSNNSYGINCANCLFYVADLAAFTATRPPVPSMLELVRYTLTLALRGGPGYATQMQQAMDTAPSLLITAGRLHQFARDDRWLEDIWPDLQKAVRWILDNLDRQGIYTSRFRSGNSGTGDRSCNAWDTFCFGHHDGYSGTLAYRGLRNAAVLARDLGDEKSAKQCASAAERHRAAMIRDLWNPATGWLAGWRSADGKLHDHCYGFINAMAACFDMFTPRQARAVLKRIEAKRVAVGHVDFRYGVAPQLDPVPVEDHSDCSVRWKTYRRDGADSFGVFTNGGLTPVFAGFYIRALSKFGFRKTANPICDQLLDSFEGGVFEGCLNGTECFTWDGTPSGYEGTLAHSYHVLLAIAQHKGWIRPAEPEFWPG